MCGISGIISTSSIGLKDEGLKMLDAISHRGPDAEGFQIANSHKGVIWFGHKRLSIQDLSAAGNQPLEYDGLLLIYNGEIYNFKELRSELAEFGYTFETGTDTEVLLKGFHFWGEAVCNKLIGMFSFAILNKKTNKLVLVRDRFGVKPLYYYLNQSRLYFASELKSILTVCRGKLDLNIGGAVGFLQRGWISGGETAIQDVRHVEPAQILTFDTTELKLLSSKKYWKPNIHLNKQAHNSQEFELLVKNSVRLRLISDVDVGCFLSGGIDSTLVAALASKELSGQIKTFNIKFEDPQFDESRAARAASEMIGSKHKEFVFKAKDALDASVKLISTTDDLFNDWSSLPLMLLSEEVSSELKVVLSGDGGDEFFHGYEKYFQVNEILRHKYLNNGKSYFKGFCASQISGIKSPAVERIFSTLDYQSTLSSQHSVDCLLEKMTNYFGDRTVRQLFKRDSLLKENRFVYQSGANSSNREQCQISDINNYLPYNILPKLDRATMAFGLEAREPLLDHRLWEYSTKLNSIEFGVGRPGKKPLADMLANILPEYRFSGVKKGFSVPLGNWMRRELKEFIMDIISSEEIDFDPILNKIQYLRYVENFMKFGFGNPKFIWSSVMYFQWKKNWDIKTK